MMLGRRRPARCRGHAGHAGGSARRQAERHGQLHELPPVEATVEQRSVGRTEVGRGRGHAAVSSRTTLEHIVTRPRRSGLGPDGRDGRDGRGVANEKGDCLATIPSCGVGGPCRTRTYDLLIKSQQLYQLS
jgi:hypothetical protein